MDRCVVLVDAGYLLGAAASLLCDASGAGLRRRPSRAALTVNYESLIAAIALEATTQSGLPLLRILWYDGAPDGQPTPDHRSLSVLPDVKVRLGVLIKREGKTEQKGVDSYLQRDMTALARNKAASDLILIGGDEDLRRGVDEAQDQGLKVHLWGVEAAEAQYNQARSLIAEADRRWVIPAAWISRHVSVSLGDAEHAHAEAASRKEMGGEIPVALLMVQPDQDPGSAAPLGSPLPSGKIVATPAGITERAVGTPADIARLWTRVNTQGAQPTPPLPKPTNPLPLLRELTNDRQEWADNEADATSGSVTPEGAGTRFASRWIQRANPDQIRKLKALEPTFPKTFDGDLLRFASRQGIDTWAEDETDKFAVRAAAWLLIRLADPESDVLPASLPEAQTAGTTQT